MEVIRYTPSQRLKREAEGDKWTAEHDFLHDGDTSLACRCTTCEAERRYLWDYKVEGRTRPGQRLRERGSRRAHPLHQERERRFPQRSTASSPGTAESADGSSTTPNPSGSASARLPGHGDRKRKVASYRAKAYAANPGYVVAGAPCDVPGCPGGVAGSRTITLIPQRQADKPLSVLIRLCARHTDTPYDELLNLLPELAELAEAAGPTAYLGPGEP